MQHQPRQVVTNSPDQQARRASLQPSIGYSLQQAMARASGSAVGRHPISIHFRRSTSHASFLCEFSSAKPRNSGFRLQAPRSTAKVKSDYLRYS